MVELDELSYEQAHRYMLLHVDGTDFYRRLAYLVLHPLVINVKR